MSLVQLNRGVLLLIAAALLSGCKISQTSTTGGMIVSASGKYDCPEDSSCEFDVPNGERFVETFTAVARHGYTFAGWRGTERYLCAGHAPLCVVDIPSTVTAYDATGSMTAEFYHDPQLIYPGSLDASCCIWSADVTYDALSLFFVADFDADGDDDVFIGAATYPSDGPFDGERDGVILTNDGGWQFSAASGDRPRGVHPREVLMADFNGDGRNDFFVADHGYDADPFPGWSNQLLLWTEDGYEDASDRLPPDDSGFSHNGAVGDVDADGDVDILVANTLGDYIEGPYLLLNDGDANFTVDTESLPDRVRRDSNYWPFAADMVDLDADGHLDLLMGSHGDRTNESFVYWGTAEGDFHDDNVSELSTPEFFSVFGSYTVISTAVRDIDGDERLDIVLGGYDDERHRGMQILINRGDRVFEDQTHRRFGHSAWSLTEEWHDGIIFLDFNGDGTEDIVPQRYNPHGDNILAWLNGGTGHYVPLRTTLYANSKVALFRFANGVIVREGVGFKSIEFHSPEGRDGQTIAANAADVVNNPVITLAN